MKSNSTTRPRLSLLTLLVAVNVARVLVWANTSEWADRLHREAWASVNDCHHTPEIHSAASRNQERTNALAVLSPLGSNGRVVESQCAAQGIRGAGA